MRLGHSESVAWEAFPVVNEDLLKEDMVELPIQINGKVRSRITIPVDADKATIEALAMADSRIVEQLQGTTVKKLVVVPGRMVSIVIDQA